MDYSITTIINVYTRVIKSLEDDMTAKNNYENGFYAGCINGYKNIIEDLKQISSL